MAPFFAMVAMQKASLWGPGSFGLAVFLPNMLKKDQPLSRYPGFEVFRERPWLLRRGVGVGGELADFGFVVPVAPTSASGSRRCARP
jgi:hypothetical protein